MNLQEFLDTFLSVEELKDLLFTLGQPLSGPKSLLIPRVIESAGPSVRVLSLLSNDALQNALRRGDLSPGGRKSELVVRLIENKVVSFSEEDVLLFLESLEKVDFDAYHTLLLRTESSQVERIVRLLAKASEEHLGVFAKVIRSGRNPAAVATLLSSISRGSGDVPAFAACVLEEMIEANGTVKQVTVAVQGASDEIMARQRRIQESFAVHPDLVHPAVDSLLKKSWSGEFAHESALLKGVRTEVRTEAKKLGDAVQSLRDSTQSETLHDISRKTTDISSKTEDIQREVQTLQDQVAAVEKAVQKHVEDSPDEVARALERLLTAKEVKWTTRRKIRKDLQRFWILTDRLQKIEFLGRVIVTYGSAVLLALKGLL